MALDLSADLANFFNTEEFAAEAFYTPPSGGDRTPVALIRETDQEFVDVGRSLGAVARLVFLAQVAEIACPVEEGIIEVRDKTLGWIRVEISGPPRFQDAAGLLWRIEGRALP